MSGRREDNIGMKLSKNIVCIYVQICKIIDQKSYYL